MYDNDRCFYGRPPVIRAIMGDLTSFHHIVPYHTSCIDDERDALRELTEEDLARTQTPPSR